MTRNKRTKGCLLLLVASLHCMATDFLPATPTDSIPAAAEQQRVRPAIFDSIAAAPDGCVPLVQINQDARIEDMIQGKIEGKQERTTTYIQGFRVQIFSSNAQKTAKTEAFKVEKKVVQNFPDIDVYVLYQPPFWKVRLGNFRTQEEAAILQGELLKAYPNMQGDIYIVKDHIQVAEN